MQLEHFKVLMYTKTVNSKKMYYIYDSKEWAIREVPKNKLKEEGYIHNLEDTNRKKGDLAVVYQSDPERYVIVNKQGVHAFRTLRELRVNEAVNHEKYFNVRLTDEGIEFIDGKPAKADAELCRRVYFDIYRSTEPNINFEFNSTTNEIEVAENTNLQEAYISIANFVAIIGKHAFKDSIIGELACQQSIRAIRLEAFIGSKINRLIIGHSVKSIEPYAFLKAEIDTLILMCNPSVITESILYGATIDELDMSSMKLKQLKYSMFNGIKQLNTLELPATLLEIDLDKLPSCLKVISIHRRSIKVICSDKNKADKLVEWLARGKNEIELHNL